MSKTFLTARWENLIMANYKIAPELLEPYMPHGVVPDTYHGNAYVSLVGFMFKDISIFKVPVPFFGSFEEVNLRFYVKRMEGDVVKRGVVFINETVPYKVVAMLANMLYKEHYIAIPTRHSFKPSDSTEVMRYEWKQQGRWNSLQARVSNASEAMLPGSIEEFIFEHYYGYTKVTEHYSEEYRVNHPRWEVCRVLDYAVDCDFKAMYGDAFAALSGQ